MCACLQHAHVHTHLCTHTSALTLPLTSNPLFRCHPPPHIGQLPRVTAPWTSWGSFRLGPSGLAHRGVGSSRGPQGWLWGWHGRSSEASAGEASLVRASGTHSGPSRASVVPTCRAVPSPSAGAGAHGQTPRQHHGEHPQPPAPPRRPQGRTSSKGPVPTWKTLYLRSWGTRFALWGKENNYYKSGRRAASKRKAQALHSLTPAVRPVSHPRGFHCF